MKFSQFINVMHGVYFLQGIGIPQGGGGGGGGENDKMQDRCAPSPRQFRKEHWLGLLTFAVTGKTFVFETMGITELNVKAIIVQICAI